MDNQLNNLSVEIAFCGLCCSNCKRFKKGKCPGCAQNEKLTWCKIRTCCQEKGIANCAECREYPDPAGCSKYNNFPSRMIEFFSGSDRSRSIAYIREHGESEFKLMIRESGKMSLPKIRKKNKA